MSIRTEQVSTQLQHLIGEIFSRELEIPDDHLLSVTRIKVSPDLRSAKVFISVFPAESSSKIMKYLKSRKGFIQKIVHENLTMKFSPKLEFLIDEHHQNALEIDRLLDSENSR